YAVDGRGEGLGGGDAGPFTAGARGTFASAETGCRHELIHQGVPLRLERLPTGGVRPVLGLGDVGLEILEPLPVRLERGGIERRAQPGLLDRPGAAGDQVDRRHRYTWPAEQLSEI